MESLDLVVNLSISALGSISAELINTDEHAVVISDLVKTLLKKIVEGLFAGVMAYFMAKYMKWGMYETSISCGVAGYASKEFLEMVKNKMKGRIES